MEDQNILTDKCRRVFAAIDSDGRGSLLIEEILTALQLFQLNPTQDEVNVCIDNFDEDVSGGFTYAQFEQFVLNQFKVKSHEEMREDLRHAFFVFDQSKTGYVDREEFRDVLTKYGNMKFSEDEADELLNQLDIGKDGRISIAELETMLVTEAEEAQVLQQQQQWDMV